MQLAEVVRTLKEQGTAQNRKVYARHGIAEPMFGVSFANLRALAKKIKRDQPLAERLWETGNHDCRVLATMIADPATIRMSTLKRWAKHAPDRCLAGELARIASRSPYAWELCSKWCGSKQEPEVWAGWATIAVLATTEQGSPKEQGGNALDELFEACLDVIEQNLQAAPNFTRYAMNNALIAIGGRNAKLRKRALAAAKKIGKVEVDHGETGCQTPDAAAYIRKIWARKKA